MVLRKLKEMVLGVCTFVCGMCKLCMLSYVLITHQKIIPLHAFSQEYVFYVVFRLKDDGTRQPEKSAGNGHNIHPASFLFFSVGR